MFFIILPPSYNGAILVTIKGKIQGCQAQDDPKKVVTSQDHAVLIKCVLTKFEKYYKI